MGKNKLFWNDMEGVKIEHEFWMSDVSNISIQFCIWVQKPVPYLNVEDIPEITGFEGDD